MSYKFGKNKLNSFHACNFIQINNLDELQSINKCENLICVINNIEYLEIIRIINNLSIKNLFVIVDFKNINILNIQKELKNNCHKYFFCVETLDDWFIIRQKIDRILLGFNVCSDMIYVNAILLLLLLIFVPVLISLCLKISHA